MWIWLKNNSWVHYYYILIRTLFPFFHKFTSAIFLKHRYEVTIITSANIVPACSFCVKTQLILFIELIKHQLRNEQMLNGISHILEFISNLCWMKSPTIVLRCIMLNVHHWKCLFFQCCVKGIQSQIIIHHTCRYVHVSNCKEICCGFNGGYCIAGSLRSKLNALYTICCRVSTEQMKYFNDVLCEASS